VSSANTGASHAFPSGLDPTSGRVGTPCLVAEATLTLALPKRGLRHAPEVVGVLFAADIAVPPSVYARLGIRIAAPFAAGTCLRVR
jgi:NAD(P)H-hydrate epimerase